MTTLLGLAILALSGALVWPTHCLYSYRPAGCCRLMAAWLLALAEAFELRLERWAWHRQRAMARIEPPAVEQDQVTQIRRQA